MKPLSPFRSRLTVLLFSITAGLFFISGKEPAWKDASNARFDLEKYRQKIPYEKLKSFRISDTLKRTAKVEGQLFYDVFQFFTTPAPGPGECGCGRTEQLFPHKEYLLSYQGRVKNKYSADSIDIVTVLSTNGDTSRIYWMCYAAHDFTDQSDMFKYKKGAVTRPYLEPVLAEKWKNKTGSFESSSEFIDASTFRVTSVLKSDKGVCIDSTIQVFGMDYVDMCVLINMARWRDGKQVIEYFEGEPR